MTKRRKTPVGVLVIGAGRIGSLRAFCASRNSGVEYLAVCDVDEKKAREVAERVGADAVGTDAEKMLDDPRINAVIVATSEGDHFEPAMAAVRRGKAVLIEKPFVLDLQEAATILDVARRNQAKVYIGYTQRFRRRFLSAKEHLDKGYLDDVRTVFGKIYVTQAVGEAVISRANKTTPSINTLTYQADIFLWFLEGKRPKTVYAQSAYGIFEKPYGAADATWAIVTFDDGTVGTLGVSWQPPKHYPAYTATMELELFGTGGTLSIDDSHRDFVLASQHPIPAPYTPEVKMNVAFVGSAMPGDWALGDFWGPMKSETDAFIDSVAFGEVHPALATGEHGYKVLELTLAIDQSAATGNVVSLPLSLQPAATA